MATSTRPDDPAVTDRDARRIGTVAVVAHRKKTLGGGLDELRARLAVPGVDELLDGEPRFGETLLDPRDR